MRSVCFSILIIATISISTAFAEDKASPPPPAETVIQVTEADGYLWERYQLLTRLAAAQLDLLRLQNEKTLAEEYAKLDQRFQAHYRLRVDQIERRGDQWVQRTPPPAK